MNNRMDYADLADDDRLSDDDLAEIINVYEGGEYQILTSRWVIALVLEVQAARAAVEETP